MTDLFQALDDSRVKAYVQEFSKSQSELKDKIITPTIPEPKDEFEKAFHAIVNKELGTSNISESDVEICRLYLSAINLARMNKMHLLAGYLTDELVGTLGLKKSVKGWQQDKLNELIGKYDVKSDVKEGLKKAGGVV